MKSSESLANLAAALSKFQADVKDPARDGLNPHFKSRYVQLDGLLEAVRPLAAAHGLSILQSTGGDGQNVTVSTMLLHTSGEWLETEPLILRPVKADPQGVGSAVTYGRRYSLSALLGVAWDDDDDGNAASDPQGGQKGSGKGNTKASGKSPAELPAGVEKGQSSTIMKAQALKKVQTVAHDNGIDNDTVGAIISWRYGVGTSKDMTLEQSVDLAEHLPRYVEMLKEGATA